MNNDHHFNSLDEALRGSEVPNEIRQTLALVEVPYFSFDGTSHMGLLVVHKEIADEVKEIFVRLCEMRFPIQKIVPIVVYGWDDDASMADNNTSAFNYRKLTGSDRLSDHAYGRAIDINPLLNPYFGTDGNVLPSGGVYNSAVPGTITADGDVVTLFKQYGWSWLGEREENTDYQHFYK